jgi:RimJ/RimL family protein N-acetyltransferase
MAEFGLETPRLVLRSWHEADVEPFYAICSDPVVMETLGPLMTREETAALVERVQRLQDELGHTMWVMESKAENKLIGWCGVIRGPKGTPIHDKLEVGWRMTPSAWGKGFVTEAATAAMTWAFDNLPDAAIWAITAVINQRSRAVMERLGMAHDPALDFDHPNVAADSPLLRHVTYRIDRNLWAKDRAQA